MQWVFKHGVRQASITQGECQLTSTGMAVVALTVAVLEAEAENLLVLLQVESLWGGGL